MSEFGFKSFRSVAESIREEEENRRLASERVLSFGVNFLDACLGGVFVDDLVLVGAKTGVGKTQLAMRIAMANAAAGKRVHYFALEAGKYEIERRMKFTVISAMLRADDADNGYRGYRRLNFMDWHMYGLREIVAKYEPLATEKIADEYKTFNIYYKDKDFSGDDFAQMLYGVQDQTDLAILDHLHYVDSSDPNENRGYKTIVKQVRDTVLSVGKPVVVVAHVRKGDAKSDRTFLDVEDFHGSSDVPKISTKAVMIAQARDKPSPEPGIWPTYFSSVKCRVDGSRTRYAALVNFDNRSGMYDEDFVLGKVESQKFVEVDEKYLPAWAIPAQRHQRSF